MGQDTFGESNADKKVKMTFGLQPEHIEKIELRIKAFDGALYSQGMWEWAANDIGWHPLTAALHYFKYLIDQPATEHHYRLERPTEGGIIGTEMQATEKPFLTEDDAEREAEKLYPVITTHNWNQKENNGFRNGFILAATKANARISELENGIVVGQDLICELQSELSQWKEKEKDIIQILEIVSERWSNDFPGSTVGIIGNKAKELLEQFKQQSK